MRIGIDASGSSGWRGPGRNIRNIIHSLTAAGAGHQFYLFAPYDCAEYVDVPTNATTVAVPHVRGVPWNSCALPVACMRRKLDIFLFPHVSFWPWKPVRTVIMTRTAFIPAWSDSVADRLQAVLLTHRFKKVADRVCAVSHFNATQIHLTCGIPMEMIDVIPNGVDPAFLDNTVTPYDPGFPYILFCGGSEDRKNIRNLITAYGLMKNAGRKEKLLIVGGKLMRSEQEMRVFTEGISDERVRRDVVIHGIERVAGKLAAIYRGAAAVVYPSTQEDFGMVSVEAMACGVPLAASHMPAIPEVAGDAALYFDPYDPAEMAQKIERLLVDGALRRELTARGRDRVHRYDWSVSARKLLAVLEQVGAG